MGWILFRGKLKVDWCCCDAAGLDENDSRRRENEKAVRAAGHSFVVTEVGGKTASNGFQDQVNRAVIGAGLNAGVIAKTPNEIHAVVHATEEALKGILVNVATSSSLALKIAIVRNEHWIVVAIFGQSALHYMTNHERAGLGIMHI